MKLAELRLDAEACTLRAIYFMRSDSGASDLLLLADIRKALLEIPKQILTFAGDVNRLLLPVFRANPSSQFLGRCMDEPSFAGDRHPLILPALSHRNSLAQEICDFSPAFQD